MNKEKMLNGASPMSPPKVNQLVTKKLEAKASSYKQIPKKKLRGTKHILCK